MNRTRQTPRTGEPILTTNTSVPRAIAALGHWAHVAGEWFVRPGSNNQPG